MQTSRGLGYGTVSPGRAFSQGFLVIFLRCAAHGGYDCMPCPGRNLVFWGDGCPSQGKGCAMKRLFSWILVACVMLSVVALTGGQRSADTRSELRIEVEQRNPWTHLRLGNTPEAFHFAVVSARTGGHRAGLFGSAVARLKLLHPAFVLSVGDLIEGYTEDESELTCAWNEVDGEVNRL